MGARRGTTRQQRRKLSDALHARGTEPTIRWQDYPQVRPGTYCAYCCSTNCYWDRAFHRWTCMLRFKVFSENLSEVIATVPMWLSLGGNEEPRASRRGRFWAEWVRANGGRPDRVDRLSPRVFVHRMAQVEIADTRGAAPYSVVRAIVEWRTRDSGSLGHQVTQSRTARGKEQPMSDLQESDGKENLGPRKLKGGRS